MRVIVFVLVLAGCANVNNHVSECLAMGGQPHYVTAGNTITFDCKR